MKDTGRNQNKTCKTSKELKAKGLLKNIKRKKKLRPNLKKEEQTRIKERKTEWKKRKNKERTRIVTAKNLKKLMLKDYY